MATFPGDEMVDPNLRKYKAANNGKYLATRLVTHRGTTIAVALGVKSDESSLFFDYSILNATDDNPSTKQNASDTAEKLDSQCWFENTKTLRFPSEIRVVGEEAVPVYEIPAVDRTGRPIPSAGRESTERLDPWLSTTLCLTDPSVSNFEVLSDGRYIYLFRQGCASSDDLLGRVKLASEHSPIDNNLLCDRFSLVGTTLSRTLEVRYRRSRQKRLPLNEKDTLAVRDINDVPFYEPTFSLRFVQTDGKFSVLQTPTATNGLLRWMIFASTLGTNQIECFTTDVASDGLFDIRGHVYYTCDSSNHEKVFSSTPGACTAIKATSGAPCGNAKTPLVPKAALSERALVLSDLAPITDLHPLRSVNLDEEQFMQGFTIEAWVKLLPYWNLLVKATDTNDEESGSSPDDAGTPADSDSPAESSIAVDSGATDNSDVPNISKSDPLPPAGTTFCLFSMVPDGEGEPSLWPSLFLDDHLRLVLRRSASDPTLATSSEPLQPDLWTHVSVTYTGGTTRSLHMTINGNISISAPYVLPEAATAGRLDLIPKDGDTGRRLQCQLDEARVWNYPLDPAIIKARMSTRATGIESYLKACWHFDEGTGTRVFDATINGYDLEIELADADASTEKMWVPSTAPILGSVGLARRPLRLASDITLQGGFNASVYYEQVSISKDEDSSPNPASGNGKASSKPLKRAARLLFCFAASTSSDENIRLAVIDFGLMSDGTLCDWPAVLNIPPLSISDVQVGAKKTAMTDLLYVDPQGIEVFGGLLAFDAALCKPEAPCVWDSSTGTITIYFRNHFNGLSALTYDVSRSIITNSLTSLSGQSAILGAIKLHQAQNVTIKTSKCLWAPEDVSVDLVITANMPNDKRVIEVWRGIPSDCEYFCNLLNGTNIPTERFLGMMSYLEETVMNHEGSELKAHRLGLLLPLTRVLLVSSCLKVGSRYYQLLEKANKGANNILISKFYKDDRVGSAAPLKGAQIRFLGYDHANLVKCEGKSAGDFIQGSSIISLAPLPQDEETNTPKAEDLIKAGEESHLSGHGRTPFFSSPMASTALQMSGGKVYTMFEDVVTTTSSPGIAFESWIKVNKITESVLVAYTSQRMPLSEGSDPDRQTFVLGIPAASDNGANYELVGNANGNLFSVTDLPSLQPDRWVHFACSLHNTLALRFSGTNYVDLGEAVEFNLSDFTAVFTLQLDQLGLEQVILTKAAAANGPSPIHIKVTAEGALCLSYWAEDEDGSSVVERSVTSPTDSPLVVGQPYKIFISRRLAQIKKPNAAPRSAQIVTMRAWQGDGKVAFSVTPPDIAVLEAAEASDDSLLSSNGEVQASGPAHGNEEPLLIGGAPKALSEGLHGSIGPLRLYSAAIAMPVSVDSLCTPKLERSMIGLWLFRSGETTAVIDEVGRNHGKLKNEPVWLVSPYKADHQLSVFVNGVPAVTRAVSESVLLRIPTGTQQLTLGNAMHGDDSTHFYAARDDFEGEFDELRIWNVPRTRENICDMMNARLSEVPLEIAVYLPFDNLDVESITLPGTEEDLGFLSDASTNCWHLTPIYQFKPLKTISQAPVGYDASCVHHALSAIQVDETHSGAQLVSTPSVTEYGDLQDSANGGMEGVYKRAYSTVDPDGQWCLTTGFRIGSLLTEWVSQMQTSPTLIGYIEGAPPIPTENFLRSDIRPNSAVRFSNAERCTYQYGLRSETGTDIDITASAGGGTKWDVAAGIGFENLVTAGEIKALVKTKLDVSSAQFKNNTTSAMSNTTLEMRVELSGGWTSPSQAGIETYKPANTGLALVESEVADIFALRLKMRGPVAPLVAYQMRPNPDIPKDRNLVAFEINKSYSKQGCLDGRRGLQSDDDYPPTSEAPKDASYFKPVEAYALKDRIRRAQEQLAGEFERYQLNATNGDKELPKRTSRNICNSYVWTADGGTFQETNSTMDFVQSEVGGNNNLGKTMGASMDMEVTGGGGLIAANFDALYAVHTNLMQTKERSSDSSFELLTELPPPVEIRYEHETKGWVKRPGSVDAYRWMSFWLEPSVESTDFFFRKVVDPLWLEQSDEPNARVLLELRESLSQQIGNARTKAWRVLHRVTYVSRVLEEIPALKPSPRDLLPQNDEKKNAQLLADISCNWLMIQTLEPVVRSGKSRAEIARLAQEHIATLYPSIRSNPRFYGQILDLLADYIGVE